MRKRLRLWLSEFNLSQQLLSIVFLIFLLLSIFYFFYLNNSIDRFVDSRMNEFLKSEQATILDASNDVGITKALEYGDDDILTNIIYDKYSGFSNNNLNKVLLNSIEKEILNKQTDNKNVNYVISEINQDQYLITILEQSFTQNFRSNIFGSLLNINFLVIFIVFVVLMIWAGSIIGSLNQLQNYVNKIKNGSNNKIRIFRRDEIGTLADALVQMDDEIKKQERVKEEMIQNISHDLKTPISTIKSYSESILDGIYPYETLDKSVKVIYDHASRLEKKVYSLLMLNKMGYLEDNAEKGNTLLMKDVIRKVLLSLKVINPDIELIADIKHDTYFHGEEEPWRIVVENLVDNAFRYANSKIIITSDFDMLSVFNDGKQMDDERIEKLFKPYEKGTDGQFGLGLSIVKRICDTYGYSLSGENLNNGVIFIIKKK